MPAQSVAVQTKVTSTTKVVLAATALATLGLAAYGFGFVPLNKTGNKAASGQLPGSLQQAPTSIASAEPQTCQTKCGDSLKLCRAAYKEAQCQQAFKLCSDSCLKFDLLPSADKSKGATESGIYAGTFAPGTLTIESDGGPSSTILVAGGDTWYDLAQFKMRATMEDVLIDRLTFAHRGPWSSLSELALATDGRVISRTIAPSSGTDGNLDLTLDSPIRIPRDTQLTFQLWAKTNPVVASSSVGPTADAPRSGASVTLGLQAGLVGRDWDGRYASAFNVRATGGTSGSPIIASGSTFWGNRFVIRRTKPTMTIQALPTTTLMPTGNQDIFRFQISSDAAYTSAVKKLTVAYQLVGTNPSLSFSNFHLRRGSTILPNSSVRITEESGQPLDSFGAALSPNRTGAIVITFTDEEIISGSGNAFTLQTYVNGARAGDAISLNFATFNLPPELTAYLALATTTSTTARAFPPGFDTSSPADNTHDVKVPFIWSDMSELPHSPNSGTSGGSRDWISETWLQDMTRSVLLAR